MNDKKLLELAAKAAGINYKLGSHGAILEIFPDGHAEWNPLTDDGDALRLAHKLGLLSDVQVWPITLDETRRAIVRAAAEIGRSMK